MINKFILKFLICFGILGIKLSVAVAGEPPSAALAHAQFCTGNFEKVRARADTISVTSADYIPAQWDVLATPQGAANTMALFESKKNKISDLTEQERLIFAGALLASETNETGLVAALIGFTSESSNVEPYRKLLEAGLLVRTDRNKAIKIYEEVITEFQLADSAILLRLFQEGITAHNPEVLLRPYVDKISSLSDDDPNKYALLAFKVYLDEGNFDYNKAIPYLKKAYDLCRFDVNLALLYSSALFFAGDLKSSKDVLLSVTQTFPIRPVYVDFLLAQIYFGRGEKVKGEQYLSVVKLKQSALPAEYQKQLSSMTQGPLSRYMHYIIWGALGLLILGITWWQSRN